MSAREWLLSVAIVAFVALKVVEGVWALEEWPLTHVPMFEPLHPEEDLPRRATLHALRDGAWFEMRPFQLGLNPDELEGRLLHGDVAHACGELIRGFNATRPPQRRVDDAYVRTRVIARPQAPDRGSETRTPCALEEPPP